MANIAKPNTFTANTAIEPAEVNDNFDTIYNEFNGGISASNLATDAVTTAKIADSNVTTAKIADDAVTAGKIDFGSAGVGVWWEEIARTTLGSAGDTITVSSIPARKYLIFLLYGNATGGTLDTTFRFNNDSGTTYISTHSASFAAAVANAASTSIAYESGATDSGGINTGKIEVIANVATEEKSFLYESVSQDASGNVIPAQLRGFGKWANTADQITRIDWINAGTGDFAIGSEIVVLGHD